MPNIQIALPAVSDSVKTNLSQDYASGNTLNVLSSVGFVSGNRIVVGEPGQENSELTNLPSAPPDNVSLTVPALNFSHAKGTPITLVNFDQYSLEYRTSSSGTWTVYGSMPANIQFDAPYTEYRDPNATSTYSWRFRYFSTEKSLYSEYSDTIGASGWPRNSVGYMVREIRKIINDPDAKTVTDTEIIRFLNAAQDKIYTLYDRWWFLLKTGTPILSVTGQKTYTLPADFGRMGAVQFEYVQGASDITYNLENLSMTEFDYISRDNNAANSDSAENYAIYPPDANSATGYLRIWPKPLTAGLNIIPRYYKTFTDLVTFGNTTEVPLPDILENYAISQIFKIRKEDDKAGTYDGLFKEQIQLLKMRQRVVARPMRNLWEYHGPNAEKRLFGTKGDLNRDIDRENFW